MAIKKIELYIYFIEWNRNFKHPLPSSTNSRTRSEYSSIKYAQRNNPSMLRNHSDQPSGSSGSAAMSPPTYWAPLQKSPAERGCTPRNCSAKTALSIRKGLSVWKRSTTDGIMLIMLPSIIRSHAKLPRTSMSNLDRLSRMKRPTILACQASARTISLSCRANQGRGSTRISWLSIRAWFDIFHSCYSHEGVSLRAGDWEKIMMVSQ